MPKVLCALTAAVFYLAATSAHAATIDFTGSDYDMGTVAIGQSGTITTVKQIGTLCCTGYPPGEAMQISSLAYGLLPPMSKITFDYIFTSGSYDILNIVGESGPGSTVRLFYDGPIIELYPVIRPVVIANVWHGGVSGQFDAPTNTGFLMATPELIGLTHGRITVTNATRKASGFGESFEYLPQVQGYDDIAGYTTYEVAAVSPVPLPAALPLFGSAALGLVAFAKRREKADLAAAA